MVGGRRACGAPSGIRTRDLHLERVASLAARLWGHRSGRVRRARWHSTGWGARVTNGGGSRPLTATQPRRTTAARHSPFEVAVVPEVTPMAYMEQANRVSRPRRAHLEPKGPFMRRALCFVILCLSLLSLRRCWDETRKRPVGIHRMGYCPFGPVFGGLVSDLNNCAFRQIPAVLSGFSDGSPTFQSQGLVGWLQDLCDNLTTRVDTG